MESGTSSSKRKRDKHGRSGSSGKQKKTSLFGYENSDNPFHDPNLSSQFVWGKNSGSKKKSKSELQAHHREIEKEVEQIKKRRLEKERENEIKEKELEQTRRERDMEESAEALEQEENFHSGVLRERSIRRVKAGRVIHVDLFVYNVVNLQKLSASLKAFQENPSSSSIVAPTVFQIFEKMPETYLSLVPDLELQELYFNLEDYAYSESTPAFKSYFFALARLCEKRAMARGVQIVDDQDNEDGGGSAETDEMDDTIYEMLKPKSTDELYKTRAEMAAVDNDAVDADFKNKMNRQIEIRLCELEVQKMGAYVQGKYKSLLSEYNNTLAEHAAKSKEADGEPSNPTLASLVYIQKMPAAKEAVSRPVSNAPSSNIDEGFHEAVAALQDQYMDTADVHELVGDTVERGLPEEGKDATTEAKNALIKPKYLNRVKSGFDWSGYNRTHYDSDNPPPKIVQGYRFNIFYPDLINKSITPSYHLHDTKDKNVCTIRFTAGPPYKDIAFQIANKPWNKGSRQGFRSTFTKGILQLHFNFVRPRYRR
jgi:hypothetical protein